MTGINQAGERWEVWLDGKRVYTTCSYARAYEVLHDIGARYGYDHAALQAKVRATQEAMAQAATVAPVVAQDARKVSAPVERQACCFVRSIRKFYACAQEKGLNTKADDAIRSAIGKYWGIEVTSRKQLSGGQWSALADAVKFGALAW